MFASAKESLQKIHTHVAVSRMPNGVTTHLPNGLALKMDGAEASDLNSTISANAKH